MAAETAVPRAGDLRHRREAELTGVNGARSGAGERDREMTGGKELALAIPAASRHSREEARHPPASCAKGETETQSTLQAGLARESAVLSVLPACCAPLDSVSPSVHEAGRPHSLPGSGHLNHFNHRDNLNYTKLALIEGLFTCWAWCLALGEPSRVRFYGSRCASECGSAHFAEEHTEAQSDEASCPRSHG